MAFRFPQPNNEDDFELFCLRFLRKLWQCPMLQRYGKRGLRQFGIDLIDTGGGSPLRAVQCKHHEPHKAIPADEIEIETKKARTSNLPLDEFYFLTTARRSTQSQDALIHLNREQKAMGLFRVSLWTWADIEEQLTELDDNTLDVVLRGDTGRSTPAVCSMLKGVLSEHLDRPLYSAASVLDGELEIIKGLLDRHEPEIAENKLQELEARAADQLQPHHQYLVKVFWFRIDCCRWEWEKAGRELLDAKRFLPNSERAKVNEALGLELIGQRDQAHSLTAKLRVEYPHNARLITIYVRTAPSSIPLNALAEVASAFVNENEELNLAFAQRAIGENRLDDALLYARKATELGAESPHAWLMLGQAYHNQGAANSPKNALLAQAERCYTRGLPLARQQKLLGLEANIRLNRGKVRYLLGEQSADVDLAAAVEIAKPDQGMRAEYASYLLEQERYDDVIREVAADDCPPTTARLFYEALARYKRNDGGDRETAATIFSSIIASEPAERWEDAHVFLVQSAVENKTQAEAMAKISQGRLCEFNEVLFHILMGWLVGSQGDTTSAKREFQSAAELINTETAADHVSLLAQGLVSVKEDAQALPLLQRAYRPGVFNFECRKLLDCAQRLERHDVICRVCRELRLAGETDPRLIHTEIQFLQLYDPQTALQLAMDYLKSHAKDRQVILWQSVLAFRVDRPELVISDISQLPAPEELTPQGTGAVLLVLRKTNQNWVALQYAYDALRIHFADEFAHGQFICVFLEVSGGLPELGVGGVVRTGMAVCLRGEHQEADQWFVIEDGTEPDVGRNEFGAEHPTSKALLARISH